MLIEVKPGLYLSSKHIVSVRSFTEAEYKRFGAFTEVTTSDGKAYWLDVDCRELARIFTEAESVLNV